MSDVEPVRPWKRTHQETRTTRVKATKKIQFDCSPETWHALERLRARYPQHSKRRIVELIVGLADRIGLDGAEPPTGPPLSCERCGRVAPAEEWPEPPGLVNDPGPRCPECWRQGHGVIPRPVADSSDDRPPDSPTARGSPPSPNSRRSGPA